MKKKYLLAPGPTPVPESALLAMAQPMIHHRTPQFSEIFKETAELLKYVFQTKQDVLIDRFDGRALLDRSRAVHVASRGRSRPLPPASGGAAPAGDPERAN